MVSQHQMAEGQVRHHMAGVVGAGRDLGRVEELWRVLRQSFGTALDQGRPS